MRGPIPKFTTGPEQINRTEHNGTLSNFVRKIPDVRPRRLIWIAALLIAAPLAFAAGARPTLTDAFSRGAVDDFERLASELSIDQATSLAGDRDRLRQLSAVEAAPHMIDRWAALELLATAALSPDRPIAVAAVRSALAIVARLDRGVIESRELGDATLAAQLSRWRALIDDPGRWPDIRVSALELADRLARALGRDDADTFLASRLRSHDAEVRRAALELLPQPLAPELRSAVVELVHGADRRIAVVAAGVVCQGITAGDDPAPIRAALGDRGVTRLRALATAPPPGTEPAMLRYIAACLERDGSAK